MNRLAPTSFLLLIIIMNYSCKPVQQPEFRSVQNFHVDSAGITSSGISLDIELYNPNDFGINLKETISDFYVNEIYLGRLTQDSTISIAANSAFRIRLKGNVMLQELLKNPLDLLSQKKFLVKATGSTKIGKIGFYKVYPFEYQQLQNLDFLK